MKKIASLLIALAFFTYAEAQHFQVLNKLGETVTNGQTLTVGGPVGYSAGVAHLDIKNIGSETLNLKAKKILITADASQATMFCWKYCYGPATTHPEDTVTLAPDSVFKGFSAEFISPVAMYQPIVVRYVIFKAENPNDSISFTFNYIPTSFQMQYDGGLLSSEEVIDVLASATEEAVLDSLWVINVSESSTDVMVRRTDLQIIDDTFNYFCWFACYSPNVYVSSDDEFITIAAGDTSKNFSAHYMANSQYGSSATRYTFFSQRNPSDSAWFIVRFTAEGTGISSPSRIHLLEVYPNPASDFVTLRLDNPSKNDVLSLFNLTGEKIKSFGVTEGTETLVLPVSDLPNGLYFLRVEHNGVYYGGHKLIIYR